MPKYNGNARKLNVYDGKKSAKPENGKFARNTNVVSAKDDELKSSSDARVRNANGVRTKDVVLPTNYVKHRSNDASAKGSKTKNGELKNAGAKLHSNAKEKRADNSVAGIEISEIKPTGRVSRLPIRQPKPPTAAIAAIDGTHQSWRSFCF